jgi:hypothetical protein
MASSKDFEDTVRHYLVNCSKVQNELNTRNVSPELEIRFGTNPKQAKPISSVDYQNVVTLLTQNGWKTDKIQGMQMLRIIPNRIVGAHEEPPKAPRNKKTKTKKNKNKKNKKKNPAKKKHTNKKAEG